jgi:hypothetical protein
MNQLTTNQTPQVKMVGAVRIPYKLVHKRRLRVVPILPHRAILAKIRKLPVQGAFPHRRPIGAPRFLQRMIYLLYRELLVRMIQQKRQ